MTFAVKCLCFYFLLICSFIVCTKHQGNFLNQSITYLAININQVTHSRWRMLKRMALIQCHQKRLHKCIEIIKNMNRTQHFRENFFLKDTEEIMSDFLPVSADKVVWWQAGWLSSHGNACFCLRCTINYVTNICA